MIDRRKVAQEFVREQTRLRNDVIGALLFGSAARGDATETSDIDIAIYIREDTGEGGWDLTCWKEGVFVEAGVVTTEGLGSLDEVMNNPIHATHMNDAFILYDPTGRFKRLQEQVRSVYMQHKWLLKRLEYALDYYQRSLVNLCEAVGSMDPLKIRKSAMALPHVASAVPLYIAGISPSSTRKLSLLAKVHPGIRAKIVHYECSLPSHGVAFKALRETCTRYHAIMNRKERGGLPGYVAWKADRTMEKGALEDAIDMLWFAIGIGEPETEHRDEARALMKAWLRGVGWEGETALAGKLELAELLQNELKEMVEECARGVDCSDA